MSVEERGREQREAPSPPAEGGVRQQLIDSKFGQNGGKSKQRQAGRCREKFQDKSSKFSIVRSTPMCPVLCRADDGCWASFDGFAARFDAAVRLLFFREHRQLP